MTICEETKILGATAFICRSGLPRRKCEFCRSQPGANQCDYLIGGPCKKCKGTGVVYRKLDRATKNLIAGLAQVAEGVVDMPTMTPDDARKALSAIEDGQQCYDCTGTGKAMCNRYFCAKPCGLRVSEAEGYCPGHVKVVLRMPCEWGASPFPPSKCYRKVCERIIEPGQRALLFPNSGRAMDESCGEAYLKLTEAKQ